MKKEEEKTIKVKVELSVDYQNIEFAAVGYENTFFINMF
jgi:hypothetical protein